MGQYYRICNISKEQYLEPHDCGDGAKLREFSNNAHGVMRALATLLVSGNGRGSGDLRSDASIIGSWAGDKIVIAGDYDEEGKHIPPMFDRWKVEIDDDGDVNVGWQPHEEVNLYSYAGRNFKNVSSKVQDVLREAGEEMVDAIG